MNAPAIVWIDERVARGLPQEKDEELAERGIEQIRYVSQTRVNDLVNAARGADEIIIQIQDVGGVLHGLTNHGRLFAYGELVGKPGAAPGWHETAGVELEP